MQDFSVVGVRQMFGGQIFRGLNVLLGKALILGVIFQKYALKLRKIWKGIENNSREMQIFRKLFNFRAGHNFLIMWKGI